MGNLVDIKIVVINNSLFIDRYILENKINKKNGLKNVKIYVK